jgi:tRNA A37 threonylcarbamoyladenosine dehydratase
MFERLISLIGVDKFKKLQKVNVLVIGLGGVGGYAFEALIRSGIINITIVDGDTIEESNLNRQIISSNNNIGNKKCDEAKERALSINPNLNIKIIDEFITKDNFDLILKDKYDYIIDACDDLNVKLMLIVNANKYKLVSCMGTANKTNSSLLEITDLDKTNNDPIARILRKKVKELKLNRKFKVVSSTETPVPNNKLGTNSYIPGIAGLLCASYVINDITRR